MLSESPLNIAEQVDLAEFCEQLSYALPALIRWVHGIAASPHSPLAAYFPLSAPSYGRGGSFGHVVRPDIVITQRGPRVCEFDFVPSGRGRLSAWLPGSAERREYLEAFCRWYDGMSARRYYYGTGTETTCWEQTQFVCQELRAAGVDIVPGNLDVDRTEGRAVDRLYYRAELAREHPRDIEVFTRESYLDSKALFAAIHSNDPSLITSFTPSQLQFLRTVCPFSFPIRSLRKDADRCSEVLALKDEFVLKNTDVESHYNWGSRGAIPGRSVSFETFRQALMGRSKDLGASPIVQEFQESLDFSSLWNEGARRGPRPLFGDEMNAAVFEPARSPVYGRASVYFLVNNVTGECSYTPWGYLLLRQDPLVHWTTDAQAHTFRVGRRAAR